MQKVDLVIAGVGAVALIATVLGIVLYDEATGEQTVSFSESKQDNFFASQRQATPSTFTLELPANATAADLVVNVAAGGTAVTGGAAQVTIDVTAPNGTTKQCTGTVQVTASATQASGSNDIPCAVRWAQPPADVTTADPGSVNETVEWNTPLTVRVTVTAPGGAGTQANSITFTSEVTGSVTTFARAAPRLPDDPATA